MLYKKNSTQKIYIHFVLFEDLFHTCIPRKQEISLKKMLHIKLIYRKFIFYIQPENIVYQCVITANHHFLNIKQS